MMLNRMAEYAKHCKAVEIVRAAPTNAIEVVNLQALAAAAALARIARPLENCSLDCRGDRPSPHVGSSR
jgi:hypothetical protein